jgi:hypothetical protein
MREDIFAVAEALKYRKIERLRTVSETVNHHILLDILKACIVEPYAILFFTGRCFQITPFGMRVATILVPADRRDHYLLAFPDLTEKFLRDMIGAP